jgi:hypothetical protein
MSEYVKRVNAASIGGMYQDKRHDELPAKKLPAIHIILAKAARWKRGIADDGGGCDEASQNETAQYAANKLRQHIHEAFSDGDVAGQHGGQSHLDSQRLPFFLITNKFVAT